MGFTFPAIPDIFSRYKNLFFINMEPPCSYNDTVFAYKLEVVYSIPTRGRNMTLRNSAK